MSEESSSNQDAVLTECSLGENWLMTDLLAYEKGEKVRSEILANLNHCGKKYIFVALDLLNPSDVMPIEASELVYSFCSSWGAGEIQRVYLVPRSDLPSVLEVFQVADNYHWESLFSDVQGFRQVLAKMIRDIQDSIELEIVNITESDVIIEFRPDISFKDAEMIEAICSGRSDGLDTTFGLELYFEGDSISSRVFREKRLHLWWD